MSILAKPPSKAKTTPLIGCNTCRCCIDPENVNSWYDPKRGKWVYRIKCHGQQFEEERIKAPYADPEAIRVGIWSPVFNCKKCDRSGIKALKLKRDYPIQGRTTFQIVHCGDLYCEMFITSALEGESDLRAAGRATPTLDSVDLTNYQGITPFAPSDDPKFVPAFHKDPASGLWVDKQGVPLPDELQLAAKAVEDAPKPVGTMKISGETVPLAGNVPVSFVTSNGDTLTLHGNGSLDVKPGKGLQAKLTALAKATGAAPPPLVLPVAAIEIYRPAVRRVRVARSTPGTTQAEDT